MFIWNGINGTVCLLADSVQLTTREKTIDYDISECTATAYSTTPALREIISEFDITVATEIAALIHERQHPFPTPDATTANCRCQAAPSSISEHGTIQVVIGPLVNQIEYCWVGRCTVCGTGWTFINAVGPGNTTFEKSHKFAPKHKI